MRLLHYPLVCNECGYIFDSPADLMIAEASFNGVEKDAVTAAEISDCPWCGHAF